MPDRPVFYPFLYENPSQRPGAPVLSEDGRVVLARLPRGARIETYTDTEAWLSEYGAPRDSFSVIIETLWAATESVSETKAELARQRAKVRRGAELDADWLPATDRRRVRAHHVALQILAGIEASEIETGACHLVCNECRSNFAIRLPGSKPLATRVPQLRIGFEEMRRFMANKMVSCPTCGKDTFPEDHGDERGKLESLLEEYVRGYDDPTQSNKP